MVARVSNLTSSSSTAAYFHEEGGYYTATGGDKEAARAKAAEHRLASAWHGQALAALGLRAGQKVSATAFETILRGHVLGTNIRLGRKREGKHEHRPGFDITFSAPKSVSLAALLPTRKHPRGDRGVLRCHDEAVKATLDWIEETKLQTRGYDPATGRRPRVKGHGMAAALFRHIASRNLDPQLHTHAVVANMTRDGEGRWKSVEPTELHRNAILFGAYYRDQLARRLIAKGYSVLPAMAGRMRSFEIAGYDRRIQAAFSSRRKEMEAFMDERGWDHGQAAAQIAALATRKRKADHTSAPGGVVLHYPNRLPSRKRGSPRPPSRGPASVPAAASAVRPALHRLRRHRKSGMGPRLRGDDEKGAKARATRLSGASDARPSEMCASGRLGSRDDE